MPTPANVFSGESVGGYVDPLVFVESTDAPELRDVADAGPIEGTVLQWSDVHPWVVAQCPASGFVEHRQVIPPKMRADRTFSVAAGPFVVVALMSPVLMVGFIAWFFA